MINITKCYETWDRMALELGDTDDKGFEFVDEPYSFLDLLRELRLNFRGGEISGTGPINEDTWVRITYTVPSTGNTEVRSLHFGTNDAKAEKYWALALKVAGFR